ncbi:MAG: IS66 family transposase [Candidatus Zambryskibacteria bacterium]|nr:IS66 family transposase [Candidatus Zambryskibacteria bacterium]
MRGHLSTEIRLQISVTRLKSSVERYRLKIKEQDLLLKEKDRKIKELEAKLVDKESQRKELLSYLYKPGKKDGQSLPRGKKPGAPAYHRPIPPDSAVTQEYTYTVRKCPICKGGVGDIVDTVVKYTEDIVLKPHPLVTKHTITRHWCSNCETYVKSPDVPPITRIGRNAMGYILYARYRLRLPMKKIQESLSDLYDFKISEGEIVDTLKDAETLFGKDYSAIIVLIQEAKAVYADETGWRMDGRNWWLWVFATTTGTQYVIEDTRGKGVPERMLGNKEDRVIISDGYAAYQNLPGDKQQCWVHLLRVAKLHSPALYGDLVVLYKKLLLELEKPIPKRNREQLKKEFTLLIEKKYSEPTVEKVKGRMKRHMPFLFTCLDHDGVLPENNTAERAIRPQVVMRKIFGGSRSLAGAKAHQVNSSVIETLRKQNPDANFFDVMLPLLEKRRSEL